MKSISIIMYGLLAVAALVGGLPFEPVDAADLVVVQTLIVSESEAGVTLYGPDGLTGAGDSFDAAVDDLALHAPGRLFLGACEHLLFTGGTDSLADCAYGDRLRPAVRVYTTALSASDLAEQADALTEYLTAHPGGVLLRDVRAAFYAGGAVSLPALRGGEGQYEAV